MKEEEFEAYLTAGKLAAKVRDFLAKLVKPNFSLLELCEAGEQIIREQGCEPAFPINVSINEIAAHYTANRNEKLVFKDGDLVKIDVGVHFDGYIGDTAITVVCGKSSKLKNALIEAANEALKAAIKLAKPGVDVSRIGEAIERVAQQHGFKPIANLTRHGISRFNLHARPQIPNVRTSYHYELKENEVIAIEPFVTNGAGMIRESEDTRIFALLKSDCQARGLVARKILNFAKERNGLPFATRWLNFSEFQLRVAIRELTSRLCLRGYPVLVEMARGLVAQAEHTVIVGEKPIVTTL